MYSLEGGQTGFEGHVVRLVHDVGEFIDKLPRKVKDLTILLVRYKRVNDAHKDAPNSCVTVRR